MQSPAASRVLRFGVFEVDVQSHELRKQGMQIKLQEQPFQVLEFLLEHAGEIVTREQLRQKLWPAETFVDVDNSVNAAINRLREALGDSAETPRFVETLPRRGYRFVAPVTEVKSTEASALKTAKPVRSDAVGIDRVPKTKSSWKKLAAVSSICLALAGGVVWGRFHWRNKPSPSSSQIHSIAVLPLDNLSGDPAQDYFADALTDELITSLAKIRELRVTSRTSVMQYRGSRKSLPEIGQELRVDALLEGAVQRSGDRVRITAQLLRTADDTHLWADRYDRDLRDVLALESDVARAIARQVQAELTPEEQKRFGAQPQVDPEAYQFYLRGLNAWNQGPGEGASASRKYFRQAIEKDPKFAPAYAWLAFSHNLNAEYQLAKGPARKALESDDSLAIAHSALAFAAYRGDWDFATADREFQRALQLAPNDPVTLAAHALYISDLGQVDQAIEEMRRALELDPLCPIHNANLALLYVVAGRRKEAVLQARTAVEIAPNYAYAHFALGTIYEYQGQYNQAAAEYHKVGNALGAGFLPLSTAHLYASAGRRAEARKLARRLASAKSSTNDTSYALAQVYAKLGDNEQALGFLEKAYQEHDAGLLEVKKDPDFKTLNSDQHFQELLRRIGLVAGDAQAHLK